MANPVDVVIGSEAIKQVQNLVNQLNLADAELLKLSQTALQAGKNISSISTPKGFNDSLANNAKISQDLDKLNTKYNALHENIVKKAEQSRLAEIKLQQAREKAFDSFEKNAKREQAINAKNETAYQRIQNSVNILTKTYQDLAIRKELNGTLTANEEKQLTSLSQRINTYQTALKKVDSDIQKNQRNVGNYASGWNGLGNSINQLTREMPAFAVSMNTGFLAISNNIPALVDEIGRLKKANIDLAASGEAPKSILGLLGKAIFSWQSLISIGVTLLTVYGKEIVEWTLSLFKSQKAIDSLVESKKALNEINLTAQKDSIKEKINLESLLDISKDTTLSYKDRLIAVKELQSTYPAYFGNLTKEQILAGNTAIAEKELTEAILSRAKAQAATTKITENQSKIIDLEEKRLEVSKRVAQAQAQVDSAEKIRNARATGGGTIAGTYDVAFVAINKLASATSDLKEIDQELNSLQEINNRLSNYAIENNKKSIKLKENETKQDKKAATVKQDKNESLNIEAKAIGTTIEQLDKYIDLLQTELILNSDNEEAYKNIKTALDQVKKAKSDLITGGGEIISTANIKEVSAVIEEVSKELTDLQKQYLGSFSAEFLQNSGFSETFAILNEEVDGFGENFAITFNAIAESAQEAFNFISSISQQRFDAEKSRLEDQYDVAIGFANGNKAAEEKLALDLEKRKKEIANREAKAKQKQAIFNIAIDTAQAIMGLWAKPGFPAAIPLAIAVGALGAAQIGIVAAQKIPQYAEGTDNHGGGLMIVNDAKGSNYQEKVILPNGKEIMPQGRNVLMDAPKGTKVLTPEQQLMEALNGTNINLSKETINRSQGMTAEQMDYVLGKHFGNITTNTTIFDENGMRTWSERNGNKTIQTNNRVTRTGIRV